MLNLINSYPSISDHGRFKHGVVADKGVADIGEDVADAEEVAIADIGEDVADAEGVAALAMVQCIPCIPVESIHQVLDALCYDIPYT
ncbi:hypothetical protein TanjilG_08127 [Lupinus angustifolius]|uniref:Uncharacterized protein n=1 Tax=Lupinus angustifolius TaxID=3871 RepID=A0A4P1RLP1_LUPAN|nr:hypothetical protein TanjilG_08127 [Lupinus angustifolius]